MFVGHGHAHDPANAFSNWVTPFVDASNGRRLEMCAGTLFMVKFINGLEREYPFADNVKPISQFARFILRQGVWKWAPVAWAILRFAARHTGSTVGTAERLDDVPQRLRDTFIFDPAFSACLTTLYQDSVDPAATRETVADLVKSDATLAEHGAVSEETARQMAEGARARGKAKK